MVKTKNSILYCYSSPTLHHGSPRVLVDIITGLDKERYLPSFLCPQKGVLTEFFSDRDIDVVIARWRSISKSNLHCFFKDLIFFWKLLHTKKINLLHMNEVGWRDSLVLAAWLRRIPIVLHLHVNYDGPIRGNWNFNFASSIIVVAEALKDAFRQQPDIHKKLVTVHNGLSIDVFQSGKSIRPALGLDQNQKVIGFIGQMVEAKGLKFLVASAKAVLDAHPDTVFLFVGRRVASEEGFVDELMQLAAQQNIAHAMRFLDPRDDIPDVMKSLDIMVLPTMGEAFPKVVLEGMGAEVPVIASAVGGIPEIIEDGVNGLLVPPGEVPALENALLDLLNNPEKRRQLAAEGLRTVRDRFSVENQIAKIQSIYDELLVSG